MKSEEDLPPLTRQRSNTLPKSFGSQLEKKPQQEKVPKPPVESTLETISKKLQEKREEVNRPEDIKVELWPWFKHTIRVLNREKQCVEFEVLTYFLSSADRIWHGSRLEQKKSPCRKLCSTTRAYTADQWVISHLHTQLTAMYLLLSAFLAQTEKIMFTARLWLSVRERK